MKVFSFAILMVLSFAAFQAKADHTVPVVVPIYNMVQNGSNCPKSSCGDHILALKNEIPRMEARGYRIYGVGGAKDNSHIGCLKSIAGGSRNQKYLQRRYNFHANNHIVATQWEIENNAKNISRDFSTYASHLGYLSQETGPNRVALVRAWRPESNDHMTFGEGGGIYEGERERVAAHGYNAHLKTLGYMFHRDLCQ